MADVNPTYNDRVEYKLRFAPYSDVIIPEPENWQNDGKTYERHKKYHGILTKYSNTINFKGQGADFITEILDTEGTNAKMRLERNARDGQTDIWGQTYYGYLDLNTYKKKNGIVSVKFTSGGLEADLKTRSSQKVEIERITTMDNGVLPELEAKTVQLDGRNIFLETNFEHNITSQEANSNVSRENGEDHIEIEIVGLPISILEGANAHDNAQSVVPNTTSKVNSGNASNIPNGESGMMFFAVSDRDRVIDIDLEFSFNLFCQRYENIRWSNYRILLTLYSDGSEYNHVASTLLYDLGSNHEWFGTQQSLPMPQFNQSGEVAYSGTWSVPAGYSMAIEARLQADMENVNHTGIRVNLQELEGFLNIKEDSQFPSTTSKMILSYDLMSRLTHIISGRNDAFYSKALGRTDLGYAEDGFASLTGFLHGMWARKFDRLPLPEPATDTEEEVVNKYKPFSTSFNDAAEFLSTVWNVGMGIEKIGYKERVRFEEETYFYNRKTVIRLPDEVTDFEESVDKKYNYSGVDIGFPKGGVYEKAMGLDEYNAITTWSTVLTGYKNIFIRKTKYRADSYGLEDCRRKQEQNFKTLDTPYDTDIFGVDLKRFVGDIFKLRLWGDDFAEKPTGVYSPETAYNLNWSPLNIFFRHSYKVASGLLLYPLNYVMHGSSTANSKLRTKIIGGVEYGENDNISNTELKRPRYLNRKYKFNHSVNANLLKLIEGKTEIDGEMIPNFYCVIEFKYKNKIYRGYLDKLKPNGEGKWELRQANR